MLQAVPHSAAATGSARQATQQWGHPGMHNGTFTKQRELPLTSQISSILSPRAPVQGAAPLGWTF